VAVIRLISCAATSVTGHLLSSVSLLGPGRILVLSIAFYDKDNIYSSVANIDSLFIKTNYECMQMEFEFDFCKRSSKIRTSFNIPNDHKCTAVFFSSKCTVDVMLQKKDDNDGLGSDK